MQGGNHSRSKHLTRRLQQPSVDSDRQDSLGQQHKQTSYEEESRCKNIVDISQRSLGYVRKVACRDPGCHSLRTSPRREHFSPIALNVKPLTTSACSGLAVLTPDLCFSVGSRRLALDGHVVESSRVKEYRQFLDPHPLQLATRPHVLRTPIHATVLLHFRLVWIMGTLGLLINDQDTLARLRHLAHSHCCVGRWKPRSFS